MKVWYLPIEPYEERYTAQLADWTTSRLNLRDVPFVEVRGLHSWQGGYVNTIRTGVALDAHGRTRWGLSQTAELIAAMDDGQVEPDDVIYLQDLYQPGYDALLYVLEQQFPDKAHRPRIFTHNLAQSIDVYDFTADWRWMRSYEHMVDQSASGVFYASTEHADLARVAGLLTAPRHVVGLLHDRDAVRALHGLEPRPLAERAKRIVYTSRFDAEKKPHFFLDLAEQLHVALRGYKIQILTGASALRSNDATALARAHQLEADGCLEIVARLDKRGYYALLAESRLQINTALQDWVSNTLLESSALGTPTLAPAYRGFPEALFSNPQCLYTPWSLDDAINKALGLLAQPPTPTIIGLPSVHHHATLDRVIDVLLAPQGETFDPCSSSASALSSQPPTS